MFVDEITIHIKAGDGGNGVAAWLHEKGKEFGGPAGGDGGKGGDVYVRAVRDISILGKYRFEKEFHAPKGENGKGKSKHGKSGADLDVLFPVGSIVTNCGTGKQTELMKEGERFLVLQGGRGGYGNKHFKGSKNIRPRQFTPGKKGEEADFNIELRLVAEAGLIGLPNAGKSSLLNELTNAEAKVASYPFTTLEPNLGDFYGHILADIPGLIEGASEGKGLGHKFLRHIERTKILLHCIALDNPEPLSSRKTVREEIGRFDKTLLEKKEIIVLTKADSADEKTRKQATAKFAKRKLPVLIVSVIDDDLLKKFKSDLLKILKEL